LEFITLNILFNLVMLTKCHLKEPQFGYVGSVLMILFSLCSKKPIFPPLTFQFIVVDKGY